MNVRNFIGIVPAGSDHANDNMFEGSPKPVARKIKPAARLHSRIDPGALPYTGDKNQVGLTHLDAERVVLRHRLTCGLEINVNAAISSYQMVAVRILASHEEDSRIYARLELVHADADLNIVLAEAECPEHLAEDWARWSDVLDLPLRLISLDGGVITPPGAKELAHGTPKPRRFGNPLTKRRTRFQAKRQTGVVGSNVIQFSPSAEIIARH